MSDNWRALYAAECEKVTRLEDILAAETKRREEAERDRDTWRAACSRVETRAEQAERERDNIRTSAEHWKGAKERAEADNAALHERIAIVERELYLEHFETAHRMAGDLVREQHPGAALLERMRALEKVREAIDALGPLSKGNVRLYSGRDFDRLKSACDAADALKVPRE